MKIEIETYKGQLITYNDESDRFECEMSSEDKWKQTKRMSLADVRKEVDTFLKLNLDFKPFKALELDKYDKKTFKEIEVMAIRTDGKFLVSSGGSYKSHYGFKDMQNVMQYDIEAVKAKEQAEKVFEQARVAYVKTHAELCKNLKPVDISKYENILSND